MACPADSVLQMMQTSKAGSVEVLRGQGVHDSTCSGEEVIWH